MDPVTAIAIAVAELAKAWSLWFAAQKPEVQQASGDHWLKYLSAMDALCEQISVEGDTDDV